jgi:hypothetical protein
MFKTRDRLAVKNTQGKLKLISQQSNNRGSELANITLGGGAGGGGSGLSVSAIGASSRENKDLTLTGLINDNQVHTLRLFYKDIYLYDPIGGSAVDMGATLPFSDFSLRGASEEQLDVFESSIERLDLRNKNPIIYANKEVYAEFISTLVYSSKQKIFVDMLEYDLNQCSLQYLPFSSMEPIITVKSDSETSKFLSSSEDHLVKMRKHIPNSLLENMRSGDYVLDPLSTLYLARLGIDRKRPTSYFQRLLPVYFLEKSLLRGTIVEANKRQRAFLHAVCGDEDWEPTAEELAEVTAMFQKADLDPIGPVISTRTGIQLSETREGGNFWKYTDIVDTTATLKYKALGISEGFLTGESTYGTAEVNLSVYMERLKTERALYTQQVFYTKLFPTIAAVNKFYKDDAKVSRNDHGKINDPSQLIIPQIHWHKSLEPINDDQTMNILEKLEEKGVPIPLRMYAAAGGLDIEDLVKDFEDDLKYRKVVSDYAQKLQDLSGEGSDEGEEEYEESSIINPRNLLKRDFSSLSDPYTRGKTGKKQHVIHTARHISKFHDIIIKANRSLKDKSHYADVVKEAKRKKML